MTAEVAGRDAVADRNQRRAAMIHAGPAVVLAAVVALIALLLLPWFLAVGSGLIVGVALAWWSHRGASGVTQLLSATASDRSANPRYHNLIDGLVVAGGVAAPTLYVVDDAAPNALVTGPDRRKASIVVTSGLLDQLDRVELEAVLAQCVSRIATNEIAPAAATVPLLGRVQTLRTMALGAVDDGQPWTGDVATLSLTRYPPGLIGALQKMNPTATEVRSTPAIDHLWVVRPGATTDDLELRIAGLREL